MSSKSKITIEDRREREKKATVLLIMTVCNILFGKLGIKYCAKRKLAMAQKNAAKGTPKTKLRFG
jgi:hypothetical protein